MLLKRTAEENLALKNTEVRAMWEITSFLKIEEIFNRDSMFRNWMDKMLRSLSMTAGEKSISGIEYIFCRQEEENQIQRGVVAEEWEDE